MHSSPSTSTTPATPPSSLGAYRWAAAGDVNAFFGLILDNVVNLAILAGILVGAFGFPADVVYTKMFPGTALGVMIGDLAYTWLAFRLAIGDEYDNTPAPGAQRNQFTTTAGLALRFIP